MEIKQIVFIVILVAAIVMLCRNLSKVLSYLKVGKDENRTDNMAARIRQTLSVAFGQTKIFRDSVAGPLHAGIFWGFLVLLFSASESIFQGVFGAFSWSFLGPVQSVICFSTDIFSVVVIAAILFSFLRRYIVKVKRLQGDASEKKDALIVIMFILMIVSSLLLEKSAHIALGHADKWAMQPISSWIAGMIPVASAAIIYEICWWVHILGILMFANYLPFSKHFHVYTSIPNVYLSNLGPVNSLETIDFEDESIEKYGVIDIDDLSWKNLLDGYTCTHCGRCTSVCPANTTGKELAPMEIMVGIRSRMLDAAPIMLKQQAAGEDQEVELTEEEQAIMDKKFVGEYQSTEALWQCTTCGACMQECPVANEHVPDIIGMRRSLVMMEADFPQELKPAFDNLETNSTPWAFSPMERAEWAEGTGVKTCAEDPEMDILFWVGCAGSFDDRAKKVSLAFARLMQIAGVNFRILGEEENCNGDMARRAGNEFLADMLIKMNVETMQNYDVKKIVTFCPHCFNTFKNDYPKFGFEVEVVHHSEFLLELLRSGKLKLKAGAHGKNITYHDSCYLGRYNNMYEAPRDLMKAIPGMTITEPGRTGDKGFCCGAGGGQMFMEETVGDRVNNVRTAELLETGVDTIALNCPFCMTMISDGVKDKDRADDVKVLDIAEILLKQVEGDEE